MDDTVDQRSEALDSRLDRIDALVASPWLSLEDVGGFDESRLRRASRLKVIAGTFDYRLGWIDLDGATRRGVTVVDTSRTMTWTVAEFAVAITLALLRDIPRSINAVRSGAWLDASAAGSRYVFRDLADCRIGLAGYGSINQHYRRFVQPYGCEVRVFDPLLDYRVAAEHSVIPAGSLVELAEASDIFVVAIPPTPTPCASSTKASSAPWPGPLFVLVSRMAVVEQEALWRRVRAEELQPRLTCSTRNRLPLMPGSGERRTSCPLPTSPGTFRSRTSVASPRPAPMLFGS